MTLQEFDRIYGASQLENKPFKLLILPSLVESYELEKCVSSGFGLMGVSRKLDQPRVAEEYKLYGHRKVMELRGVEIFVPDWD